MIRSLWTWLITGTVILSWLPLLAVRRLFDRDPALYKTGLLFRKCGRVIARVNPSWRVRVFDTETVSDHRRPYVVVCNHQSLADIPIISHVPWEMKWMAKKELFELPLLGWMLRLSGDISVDRGNARSGVQAILKAKEYLAHKCSVFIFPEGTRTKDGRVGEFSNGAFHLALKEKIAILPIVIEGTFSAIQKSSWKFGKPSEVLLKVLPVIETAHLTMDDLERVRDQARQRMIDQIAEWRGVEPATVDGLVQAG